MARNVTVYKEEKAILKEYSDLSRAELTTAYNSYNNYIKYMRGELSEFSEYTLNEMRVIYILDSIGYPVDKLGTYFYKDVIVNVFTDLCFRNNYQSVSDLFDNMTALLDDKESILYSKTFENEVNAKLSKFQSHIQIASDIAKSNREKGEYDKDLYNAIFFGNGSEQSEALITNEIVLYLLKVVLIERDNNRSRTKKPDSVQIP